MTTQQEVMPRELHLSAPPTIPQARTYMAKMQAESPSYDFVRGTRVRINIPRLQQSYLTKDSYLRFRLNLTGYNTTYLDRCGAYGLFERMEVYDYLGGTLLEQTANLPALITLLQDIDKTVDVDAGAVSSVQGFGKPRPGSTNSDYEGIGYVCPSNVGARVQLSSNNNIRYDTTEFCIFLPSFLGLFSSKFVPLHNGFSIDLFLNSPENALVSGISAATTTSGLPKYATISNVELCCHILELGSYGESLLQATEPWVIHAVNYRYFNDTVTGQASTTGSGLGTGTSGSSFQRLDLNLNVVSLRNIFFGMRPLEYMNNIYRPTYGHRIRNFLDNFTFQYGSSYLPEIAGVDCRGKYVPNGPDSNAQFTDTNAATGLTFTEDFYLSASCMQGMIELAKTRPSKNSLISQFEYRIDVFCSGVNPTTSALAQATYRANHMKDYTVANYITNNVPCGKFVGGLNLQLSQKEAVCGIDTNGLLVSLNLNFNKNTTASMVNAILDAWAEYDAFVQIIPGVATTTTF